MPKNSASVLGMFSGILQQMKISRKELEDVEDELILPKMSQQEMSDIADKGIEMSANRQAIEISDVNGIFSYKKRPAVVYIKDQYLDINNIAKKKYNKYHLCYCKALRQAEKEHRFYNRYVMVRRTKGDFWTGIYEKGLDYLVEDYAYRKLNICQDCLRQLNWKNFNQYCGSDPNSWWQQGDQAKRSAIVSQFSIAEFLRVMRDQIRKQMNQELRDAYMANPDKEK